LLVLVPLLENDDTFQLRVASSETSGDSIVPWDLSLRFRKLGWGTRIHLNGVSAWHVSLFWTHSSGCLILPSSCKAAPLLTKAQAQLKEVAFCQLIRRCQIMCCYRVRRPCLLN